MNQKPNMQSVVTRNVILVGTYKNLTEKAAAYMFDVHGHNARITIVSPKSDEFTSSEGLKKLISSTDKRVYVAKGAISERNMTFAQENGLSFTELHQDDRGNNVVGHWYNISPGQTLTVISSKEQIEALKAGKQLAGTAS